MNIPDEVLAETQGLWEVFSTVYEPGSRLSYDWAIENEPDVLDGIRAVAEWARKEALREAAESVRDYWATFGDLISSNNGARLAFEAVAARIAEGVRS